MAHDVTAETAPACMGDASAKIAITVRIPPDVVVTFLLQIRL